jgi:hypothetical protein
VNTPTRVAAFGAGLVVAFSGAFGLGRLADLGLPSQDSAGHAAAAHGTTDHATTGRDDGAETAPAELPGGLQVAQDGYRLALDHPLADPGSGTLSFRIVDADGRPLTSYTRTHDKDLHLVVVRRDLAAFRHVHPQLGADGTWSIPFTLTPGAWRVFADFDPAGAVGPLTLGADLLVPGDFTPATLPTPSATAEVDGYTVTLDGTLAPGRDSTLTLSVSRAGRPVTDLQPYLAAYGHLVALRQGDLAYLHVHPDGEPGDGRTPAGPAVVFHTTPPSAGTYRLYLDFQHEGVVRTAELTVTAGPEVAQHGH